MSARPPSAPAAILAFAMSALVGTAAVVASVRTPSPPYGAAAPMTAPSVAGALGDPSLPGASSVVIDDLAAGEPAPTF